VQHRLGNAEAIVLSGSELLAEVIVPTTSSLGWLLHRRFQCAFETSAKSIFARAILLDIEHTVFGGMKFDLQTDL
jgi:hypothetical protein